MNKNIFLNENIIYRIHAGESTSVTCSNVRWHVFLLKVGQILIPLQELS